MFVTLFLHKLSPTNFALPVSASEFLVFVIINFKSSKT